MRFANWLLVFMGALLLALPAGAQTQAQRIRGTIVGLDGLTLTVATRQGPQVKIAMAENFTVGADKDVDLAAIAPGSFVGVTAQPIPGGGWKAIAVVLFPELARGAGEGHYGWDLAPGTSMTNATVTAVVSKTDGHDISLRYKDSNLDILVPAGTPLVTPTAADRSDVKPGAYVILFAMKHPDGSLSATRMTVEKDGVKPPM